MSEDTCAPVASASDSGRLAPRTSLSSASFSTGYGDDKLGDDEGRVNNDGENVACCVFGDSGDSNCVFRNWCELWHGG
jgi:hypothetical protein